MYAGLRMYKIEKIVIPGRKLKKTGGNTATILRNCYFSRPLNKKGPSVETD